jgi:hypothetical protein
MVTGLVTLRRTVQRDIDRKGYERDVRFRELCWAIEDGNEDRAWVLCLQLCRVGRELSLDIDYENTLTGKQRG